MDQAGLRDKRLALVLLPLMAAACGAPARPTRTSVAAATEATQPAPAQEAGGQPRVDTLPAGPVPTPALGEVTPEGVISAPPTLMITTGLAAPESVLYDIESDVYLVSNVNGSPSAADDNGYIARIAPDGQFLDPKFIDGARSDIKLNAPKGMAISAGILFVSDLDRIRKFDVKTGAPRGEVVVRGVTFANDVAAGPDGTIYFTDSGIRVTAKGVERTGTDAVYKLVKGQPKLIAQGRNLDEPNGLFVDQAGVWVVTYAGKQLYNIKTGSKASVQQLPGGALDGVVRISTGKLYVSSWEANQVFVAEPGGSFVPAFEVKTPADIGYDVKRNRLLIPMMGENAVRIQPL